MDISGALPGVVSIALGIIMLLFRAPHHFALGHVTLRGRIPRSVYRLFYESTIPDIVAGLLVIVMGIFFLDADTTPF